MKKAQNPRRSRARTQKRGNGHKNGNSNNRSGGQFRGNPKQQIDKYKALAREAQQSGDRVQMENWLQHADHYQRILNERMPPQNEDMDSDDEDDGEQQEQHRPSRSRRARARDAEEANQRDRNARDDGDDDHPSSGRSQKKADPTDAPQPDEQRDERELVAVEVTPDGEEVQKPKRRRGRPRKSEAIADVVEAPTDDAVA